MTTAQDPLGTIVLNLSSRGRVWNQLRCETAWPSRHCVKSSKKSIEVGFWMCFCWERKINVFEQVT
jgi:hypothetical protein